jgi:hypothetical protein
MSIPANSCAFCRCPLWWRASAHWGLLACLVLPLLSTVVGAAEPATPKRVLALYWYGKDFPSNVVFDQSFQKAFRAAPGGAIEYYAEYFESNRFPGENQSLLLCDYLDRKYADHKVDVVMAVSFIALDFLLKHRNDLFPDAPIVFSTLRRPELSNQAAGPGITGIVATNAYKNTLDLALRLHPATEQAFIITGTPERDKRLETDARKELKEFESSVALTYLTDLPLDELIATVKGLPERSIILYVRHFQDEPGKFLEPRDVLALVAQSANVPTYGISDSVLGHGIVGGSVYSNEDNAAEVAKIALRVANGARAQDVPVVEVKTVPTFDWRQLRRWRIAEDRLPPGSIVRFKEPTFWEHYKWRIIGMLVVCAVQALLISVLLVERAQRRRARAALSHPFHKYDDIFVNL